MESTVKDEENALGKRMQKIPVISEFEVPTAPKFGDQTEIKRFTARSITGCALNTLATSIFHKAF